MLARPPRRVSQFFGQTGEAHGRRRPQCRLRVQSGWLSFTRAADALFISRPALSKQLRQLELSLRTKLFERDRRTVRLTEEGAALLPHARRIISQCRSHSVLQTSAGVFLITGMTISPRPETLVRPRSQR
ncbi:LysR family transcriptional regulator [Actinocrispum sp. NPDC049592]|uniref:LysR family transcriptional regulator n=1 Tax=Actinocrispum sp. NPDC049592 TaxID=3154835 RepID=UPI003431305D